MGTIIGSCSKLFMLFFYNRHIVLYFILSNKNWEELYWTQALYYKFWNAQKYNYIRTLIHCWWKYKMLQPFWKIAWHFLKKVKLLFNPETPLVIYQKKMRTCQLKNLYTNACSSIVPKSQLFITWWADKLWHAHQLVYHIQPEIGMQHWYMLQHGWTMKAAKNSTYIAWFPLYKISREGKSMDRKQGDMGRWGGGQC